MVVFLCREASDNLDHVLWNCQFTHLLWDRVLELFGLCLTRNKDCHSMLEKVFLHPSSNWT